MNLPIGASAILKLRHAGQKPADPVIVSCVGPLHEGNPTVVVTNARHDWRFLADLEVVVFVGPGAEFVPQTLRGLAPHARDIVLWDAQHARGANLLPVWKYSPRGRPERFLRWARLTWTPHENRKFAQCE